MVVIGTNASTATCLCTKQRENWPGEFTNLYPQISLLLTFSLWKEKKICWWADSLDFFLQPAINQLEDSQLAWHPFDRCSLLLPWLSVNVDSCQSQSDSIRGKNPDGYYNTAAVAQGSVNDWRCWIRVSGLRPAGFLPHPGPAPLRMPVYSGAHLQSDCVVFMWSILSSHAEGFCLYVCLASTTIRYLLSWAKLQHHGPDAP